MGRTRVKGEAAPLYDLVRPQEGPLLLQSLGDNTPCGRIGLTKARSRSPGAGG